MIEINLNREMIIILRITIALCLGLLIGLERQRRKTETNNHGAAGLRTYSLVCVGTTLITSVGSVLFPPWQEWDL
jgi:uncharacterized membrane protein YhiD involved in acid resistance